MTDFIITRMGIAAFLFFNALTTTGQEPKPAAKETLESGIALQESQQSDALPPKVILRWKFKPGQVFQGKLAYGIRTMDDNPQKTSFIYEYTWEVQSLRNDGRAVVKVIMNRERFQHRSAKVHVDYDSNDDASFRPSETELSEIEPFVDMVRQIHKKEYLFIFSDQGEIWQAEAYESKPGIAINCPQSID